MPRNPKPSQPQTQHTPGPWRTGDLYHTVFGPKAEAACPKTIAHMVGTEVKANARLIAAAPELLAACETVLGRVDHTNIHTTIEDMRETWNLLREAIAKAVQS